MTKVSLLVSLVVQLSRVCLFFTIFRWLETDDSCWVCSETFNNPDTATIGTVTAIYEIGCFLGAILTFYIGNKLGRKKAIWLGLAIMLVGTVLQTTAYGIPHMIVGRIVTGIGNGINTSTVPMYACFPRLCPSACSNSVVGIKLRPLRPVPVDA
jgi:MFS family permease